MNFRSTIIFLLLISRVSADDRCMVLSRVPNDQQCTVRVHDDASKCGTYADRIDTELRCRDSPHLSEFACVCDVDDEDCPNATPGILDMLLEQITVLELFSDKVNPLHACLSSAVVQYADRESAPKVSTEASGPVGSHLDSSSSPTEEALTSEAPLNEATGFPLQDVDETSSTTSFDVPSAETSSHLSQSTEHHLSASTQSHESSPPAVPPSAPLSAESASTLASTSSSEDRSPGGDVTSSEVNEVTTIKVAVTYSSETIDLGPDEIAEVTRPLVDSGTGTSPSPVLPVERPYDFTIIIIVGSVLGPALIICICIAGCFWLTKRNRGGKFAAAERTPRVKGAEDVWRQIEEGVNQEGPPGSVAAACPAASPASSFAPSPAAAPASSPAAAPAAAPASAPPPTTGRRQKPRKVACHPHLKTEHTDRGPLEMYDATRDGRPMSHAMEGEESLKCMPPFKFDTSGNEVFQMGSGRELHFYGPPQTNTDPTQSESIRMAEEKKSNKVPDTNGRKGRK